MTEPRIQTIRLPAIGSPIKEGSLEVVTYSEQCEAMGNQLVVWANTSSVQGRACTVLLSAGFPRIIIEGERKLVEEFLRRASSSEDKRRADTIQRGAQILDRLLARPGVEWVLQMAADGNYILTTPN